MTEQEVCQMYREGSNYHQIRMKVGIGPAKIKEILISNGVEIRPCVKRKILSDEQRKQLAEKYAARTHSFRDLMIEYGVSSIVVKSCLMENGIDTRANGYSKIHKNPELRENIYRDFLRMKTLSGLANKYSLSRDCIEQALKMYGLTKEELLQKTMFVYESKKGDVFMKSKYEVDFAYCLDEHELRWEYEPFGVFHGENNEHKYTPDFVIYDEKDGVRFIIDVKAGKKAPHSPTFRFQNQNGAKFLNADQLKIIVESAYPGSEFMFVHNYCFSILCLGMKIAIGLNL